MLAVTALVSGFGTSRCFRLCPVAVGVSQSFRVTVHIGVAAVTGMGGVALLDTSRSSDYGLMVMTHCIYYTVVIRIAAMNAYMCCITNLSAGRFDSDRFTIIMSR
jgi:hypothetical protein